MRLGYTHVNNHNNLFHFACTHLHYFSLISKSSPGLVDDRLLLIPTVSQMFQAPLIRQLKSPRHVHHWVLMCQMFGLFLNSWPIKNNNRKIKPKSHHFPSVYCIRWLQDQSFHNQPPSAFFANHCSFPYKFEARKKKKKGITKMKKGALEEHLQPRGFIKGSAKSCMLRV